MSAVSRMALAGMLALCSALPAMAQNSTGYTPPAELSQPQEVYPLLAREMHEEGTTQLNIVINADGTVGDAMIAKTSGFTDLDEAALGWVHQWLYRPAMKDGRAVPATTKVNVTWTLAGSAPEQALAADIEKIVMPRNDFPSGAWDANEKGICEIVLTVDQRGSVVDYRLIKSSGFADLDDAAKKFLTKRWHITPMIFNAKPAKTYIPVEVIWSHDAAAN